MDDYVDIISVMEKPYWNKVEYTFHGWIENFNDYLKSTMSYLNCTNFDALKEKATFVFITENSFRRLGFAA